jgi:preprotein translocase SecE subunit
MANARPERHASVPRVQSGQPEERHGHFLAEAWAELKKVEWPGQNQVIQGTVVVLVACVVVGAYLYVNDYVWKHVVSKVFLGQ